MRFGGWPRQKTVNYSPVAGRQTNLFHELKVQRLGLLIIRRLLAHALNFVFFSSRRRHTRFDCDWSSDVCSSDLGNKVPGTDASTLFELVAGADPYFTNVDPTQNNVFYLSQDLRVFTSTPGQNTIPVRSEERRVGKECRSRWSPDH